MLCDDDDEDSDDYDGAGEVIQENRKDGEDEKNHQDQGLEPNPGADTTSPSSPSTSTSMAAFARSGAATDRSAASRPIAPLPRLSSAYSLAPQAPPPGTAGSERIKWQGNTSLIGQLGLLRQPQPRSKPQEKTSAPSSSISLRSGSRGAPGQPTQPAKSNMRGQQSLNDSLDHTAAAIARRQSKQARTYDSYCTGTREVCGNNG